MRTSPKKRRIISVDMTADAPYVELQEALAEPNAKIISEVASGETIVYIIEYE